MTNLTTKQKTVSVCCKCPVFVEGDVTTYWVCEKCRKACDITTTNPPTEPEQLQPSNSTINTCLKETTDKQLTNVKSTINTEPTVEKWEERDRIEEAHAHPPVEWMRDFSSYIHRWTFENSIQLNGVSFVQLQQMMWDLTKQASSLQEAKAEMIYKALDEIGNVNAANALSKGEAKWEFKNGLDCTKAILNHLLASLKQEEVKCQ